MTPSRMQALSRLRSRLRAYPAAVALTLGIATGCLATDETDGTVLDEQEAALDSELGRCLAATMNRPVTDCHTNDVDLIHDVTLAYCRDSAQLLLNTIPT